MVPDHVVTVEPDKPTPNRFPIVSIGLSARALSAFGIDHGLNGATRGEVS
ncbi:MAG: hypothetical protein WBB23_24655 [Desulforhopalus sp.]